MSPRVAAVLPSRDEVMTIADVARAVDAAISESHGTVLNIDKSTDAATAAAFRRARCRSRRYNVAAPMRGKGAQVLSGLSRCADAADCVLLADTDTRSPAPDSYRQLVRAVLSGADLALAGYRRYWYEGNLTNHIARPLVAAVTGQDIPQPIVGDIALSGRAARTILAEYRTLAPSLRPAVHGYGIDAFITLTVALRGGPVVAVPLDRVKRHAPSFPHLQSIFDEAVPVLLADSPRAHPAVASIVPQFALEADVLPVSAITTMCDWLDRAALPVIPGDALWPTPLVTAWMRAREGEPLDRITRDLWPSYAQRTRQYLDEGQDARLPFIQDDLAASMTAFLTAAREPTRRHGQGT